MWCIVSKCMCFRAFVLLNNFTVEYLHTLYLLVIFFDIHLIYLTWATNISGD